MEPLFEANYTRTHKLMRNFYFRASFPLSVILLYVFLILYMAFLLLINFSVKNIIFSLFFLLIEAFGLVLPGIKARIQIQRDRESNGGELLNICVKVTDEGISQKTAFSDITLDFSNIKRLIETKKSIYLITGASQLIMMPKDSFTVGTPDDFVAYIKGKNPQSTKKPISAKVLTSIIGGTLILALLLITISAVLNVNKNDKDDPANAAYMETLHQTIAKYYDEYELLDNFNIKQNGRVTDVFCLVRVEEEIEILSYYRIEEELFLEKKGSVEFSKAVTNGTFWGTYLLDGSRVELTFFDSMKDIPNTVDITREIVVDGQTRFFCITFLEIE